MSESTFIDTFNAAMNNETSPFRVLMEMMPQMIAYIDADQTYRFVNAAYRNFFNIELFSIIGQHPSRLLGPEAYQMIAPRQQAALQGMKQEFETAMTLPNGKEVHVHAHYLPHVVNGSVNGFLVIVKDISQKKQLREALHQSELKFRQIAETISDVFWISTTGVGRMIYVSPAYEHIWERSVASLYESPQSFLEAVHPEDREELTEAIGRYHTHGMPYRLEYRIVRKNGDVRWIEERGYPVAEVTGGDQLMTGVCKDVTDRKLTEAKLKHSKESYRAVVEDQTEVICRFTPDGIFTFVNDTYCRFFGKTQDDLIGNKWHPVAHQEDLPVINHQLNQMSSENPVVMIENRVWNGEGSLRHMQFINRGFYDTSGQLIEIQSVGRDITDLKEKEILIARKEKELEAKTAELEKLNTALEVVLAQRDKQLTGLKKRIHGNIHKLILPDLDELGAKLNTKSHQVALQLIKRQLEDLLSSETEQLTSEKYNLTKMEFKIAMMIKNDLNSNDIANHLHISLNTVAFHRKNLRKKLGIFQSGVNLSVHLKHHL